MKYFKKPYTATNLQKQFWAHSKTLHPDVAGDHRKFIEMQNQYRDLLFIVDNGTLSFAKAQSEEFKKMLAPVYARPKFKRVRKGEIKKQVIKNVVDEFFKTHKSNRKIKINNTVYIVDLDEMFNGLLDKFL